MSRTFFILTHGCQMNEYDSAKMADSLKAFCGLTPATSAETADVLLLNTCSIREKAQEKVFSELGRWQKLKARRPEVVIAVGGCVASQEGEELRRRAPYVDIVFGPQTLHRLPKMLNEVWAGRSGQVDVSFPEIEKFDYLPKPQAQGATAFVSIMEGCNKYCSFCVVPYTRGEEISRPLDDVLSEIMALADQNVREITLLGQNVNDYRGQTHEGHIADLAVLIEYLSQIKGIDRIRYTTSHPLAFSDRLIETYARIPKLVDHLHLPVQSGSDRILTAMKRNHTILEYKAKLKKLRRIRPNIAISTDIIVGFPGETDHDFAQTLQLVDDIGFDNSFTFIYSARPGTPAASLPDDVPMSVKKERLAILQARIAQHAAQISHDMIGSTQTVLVDKRSRKDSRLLAGRTENNRVVNFEGPDNLMGDFAQVIITETQPNSLRGRLVASLTETPTAYE